MTNPGQAHADAERLHAFANDLSLYAERIRELDHQMQNGLTRLGETFRDAEYEKFRAHFRSSREKLLAFVEEVKTLVPKLRTGADDLGQYDRIKLEL